MSEIKISVSKDFAPFPAGRYISDGKYTGEGFRKKILVKALNKHEKVVIALDGKLGYGSSFLEEAFGGLVREDGFSEKILLEKLVLECSKESIPELIYEYIHKAQIVSDKDQENGS